MISDLSQRLSTLRLIAETHCERGNQFAEQGQEDAAISDYHHAIQYCPDYPEVWNNLGNVLRQKGQWAEAVTAYRHALTLGLNHPVVYYNLGTALRQGGEPNAAITALNVALAVAPEFPEIHNNLGNAFRDLERFSEAVEAYLKAVHLQPEYHDAHANLASAVYLLYQQTPEYAIDAVRRWRAEHPDHPVARHVGAALAIDASEPTPERASDDYVRQTFNRFAEDFDEKLRAIGYRVPELILSTLAAVLPSSTQGPSLEILDAGCGTGLCGPGLRRWAKRLEGMDLSSGMLAQADRRGVYDALEVKELTEYLALRQETFDVIAAADVFCYFGALEPVFRVATRALRCGGWFVFSVERAEENETAFRLGAHGRYQHGETALRVILENLGLSIEKWSTETLRCENGCPVFGFIVLVKKINGDEN
ncbi:Tetratricopeptide repeat protein [Azospirillaceae bacterium]